MENVTDFFEDACWVLMRVLGVVSILAVIALVVGGSYAIYHSVDTSMHRADVRRQAENETQISHERLEKAALDSYIKSEDR